MKVKVNKDVCIACGSCTYIADDYFVIGNDGYAEVAKEYDGKDVPEEKKEKVEDALNACPTSAIEEI